MTFTINNYQVRSLAKGDVPLFFQLIETNRERLEDFFATTVANTKTPGDTAAYVDSKLQMKTAAKYFSFVIVDTNSMQLAGFIDVKNIDWRIPKEELGCFIDANHTKQQLAAKALQWVINHMFKQYGINKLNLRTHESNKAARALAEKCGFEIEGKIRMDHKTTKGEIVDLLYYGLQKN